ncbi:hypothetical protein [Thiolapillus brandeum]|uniref:Uncharacterized protein n=1 Tax=Thiolapillus brandeum TaxID=1076588 RepID=A0A7U6GKD0_9GAMM|nr:hypothetical protein [Thiolapillus brandeum]BAO45213.1 conserved hypothetical protein [Thiolapillus brandeum]
MSAQQPKPPVAKAMRELIAQARSAIPFDTPEAQLCADECRSCSVKLLEFLAAELDDWEARLDAGETPGLAELSRLARTARKVHRALEKNGLPVLKESD